MPPDHAWPEFVAARLRELIDGGELEPRRMGPFGLVYVVTDRGAAALEEEWW